MLRYYFVNSTKNVNRLRSSAVVLIKNYNMDLQFEIQTIKFNSLSDWLILNGSLHQGTLSSELLLKVEQSFLNKILNRLQGINPETSVNDYLKSHHDVNLSDYEFDFKSLKNNSIPMKELKMLSTLEDYKFIRA